MPAYELMNAHAGNSEQILNQRPTALTRCVSAGLPRTPPPPLRAKTWGPPTCQMRCGVGLVGPPLWRESQRSEGEVEAGIRTSLGWVIDSIPWWQPRPFRSDPNFCFSRLGEGRLWALGPFCKLHWAVEGGASVGALPGDQDPDSPCISCSQSPVSFS